MREKLVKFTMNDMEGFLRYRALMENFKNLGIGMEEIEEEVPSEEEVDKGHSWLQKYEYSIVTRECESLDTFIVGKRMRGEMSFEDEVSLRKYLDEVYGKDE